MLILQDRVHPVCATHTEILQHYANDKKKKQLDDFNEPYQSDNNQELSSNLSDFDNVAGPNESEYSSTFELTSSRSAYSRHTSQLSMHSHPSSISQSSHILPLNADEEITNNPLGSDQADSDGSFSEIFPDQKRRKGNYRTADREISQIASASSLVLENVLERDSNNSVCPCRSSANLGKPQYARKKRPYTKRK